jgi:hypothetical protein
MRTFAFLCFLVCSSTTFAAQVQRPPSTRVVESGLPIIFEPASPQGGSGLVMVGHVAGMTIGFRPKSIVFGLPRTNAGPLQIGFDGARPIVPSGTALQKSQTNYLLGGNSSQWRTHVPNYAKVTYSGLYPGIDAVFYGNGHQLEHDFIVSPGADYHQIRMHLSGNSHASLEIDGTLSISLKGESLQMRKPFIYQEEPEGKTQRNGSFHLLPDGEIGFTVADYDPDRALVIDPVLSFSTYLTD